MFSYGLEKFFGVNIFFFKNLRFLEDISVAKVFTTVLRKNNFFFCVIRNCIYLFQNYFTSGSAQLFALLRPEVYFNNSVDKIGWWRCICVECIQFLSVKKIVLSFFFSCSVIFFLLGDNVSEAFVFISRDTIIW